LIGLPEGRYLAREGDAERVLIVQQLGAARPGRRRRRRARQADPGEPEVLPLTRVTVTGQELADARAGERWLQGLTRDAEGRAAEVRSATRLVNRALNALRAGARDPLVQEIGATRALVIRVGYGTGQELAEGRWTDAKELPKPRSGRLDDVEAQTRVASVLAGRDEVHPAETLLLRARLDAEQGRAAEARYGLRAASAALEDQPAPRDAELRKRLRELEKKLDA
jgi:hypothetical protein